VQLTAHYAAADRNSVLPSVGLAPRAVQVEDQLGRSTVLADAVNPLPGTPIKDLRFLRVFKITVLNRFISKIRGCTSIY